MSRFRMTSLCTRAAIVLLMLLISAVALAQTASEKKIEAELKRAQSLYSAQKVDEAIALAEKALGESRTLPVPPEQNGALGECLIVTGEMYATQGRWEEADNLYSEVLAIAKKAPPEEGAQTVIDVLTVKEQLARAQTLLLKMRIGEAVPLAEETLHKCRSLQPTAAPAILPGCLATLGSMYLATTRFADAHKVLTELLALMKSGAEETNPFVSMIAASDASAQAMLLLQEGQLAEAAAMAEKSLQESRARKDNFAIALNTIPLAVIYIAQGREREASSLMIQGFDLLQKVFPKGSPYVTIMSSASEAVRARELFLDGRIGEANHLAEQTLRESQQLGEHNAMVGINLNLVANLYMAQARFEEAARLFRKAIDIFRNTFPPESLVLIQAEAHEALARAMFLFWYGKPTEAVAAAEEGLRATRKLPGEQKQPLLEGLLYTATLYRVQGRFAEAESLQAEALAVGQKGGIEDNPLLIGSFAEMGVLAYSEGRYPESERFYLQALDMMKKQHAESRIDFITPLSGLGVLYMSQGRIKEAEPLALRALEMAKKLTAEDSPVLLEALNNAALVLATEGRYPDAEKLYLQALEIWKLKVETNPEFGATLSNLGMLYVNQGRYAEAETVLNHSLEVWNRLKIRNHQFVALTLNNLGMVYLQQGRNDKAEGLMTEARQILIHLKLDQHPDMAKLLNNLGTLYLAEQKYKDAEPILLKAIEMEKKLLPENHPDIATILNNLSQIHQNQKQYAAAQSLLLEARQILEKATLVDEVSLVYVLNNLAAAYRSQGQHAAAVPLLEKALEIEKRKLGNESPLVASIASNLAVALWTARDSGGGYLSRINQLLGESAAVRSATLGHELKKDGNRVENVRDNLVLLSTFASNSKDMALSFALRPGGLAVPETAKTALLEVWEQKGRAQEEARHQGEKVLRLSVSAVQRRLPDNAALLEFALYHDFKPDTVDGAEGERRYAVCILLKDGDPVWLDLGAATVLEGAARDFLEQVRDSHLNSVLSPHFSRFWPLFVPILDRLKNAKRLFVAEDDLLNSVPLQALKTQRAGFEAWADRFEISYLNSGRDLVWHAAEKAATGPAVVAGLNKYGLPAPNKSATQGPGKQSGAPLPAEGDCPLTINEFVTLQQAEPMATMAAQKFGVTPLLGLAATRENLQNAVNTGPPSALVVVVHGCVRRGSPDQGNELALVMSDGRGGWTYLPSVEISQWPLQGSALYVISCWAGSSVGKVVGDLRQAATLAGARYLIAPLWDVPEDAARDFLDLLLQEQQKPASLATALQRAQDTMRKTEKYANPYFWAGYTVSGVTEAEIH